MSSDATFVAAVALFAVGLVMTTRGLGALLRAEFLRVAPNVIC